MSLSSIQIMQEGRQVFKCFLLANSKWDIQTHQTTPYLDTICKSYKGVKGSPVDDPKPCLEPDVNVVDISKINMYLMCKVLGCWFSYYNGFIMPYLTTSFACIIQSKTTLNSIGSENQAKWRRRIWLD